MPIISVNNRIRGRRPVAGMVLLIVLLVVVLQPLMAVALAHEGGEAATAVSLNDDDGAESPWREATPKSRPRKQAHASTLAKEGRGLQQAAPTRVPSRSPTKQPTKRPTKRPTRAPTAPTKQPTRRPTTRPTQWATAGPTRRGPPPPTHVMLGGKSYDRVVVVAMAALGVIAIFSILGVIAHWCCRRPAQACIASLGPPPRRRNAGGGATPSSTGGGGGGGGAGGHLAVASLYYDTDEMAYPERYRAFRTPPRRTGTLFGHALDDATAAPVAPLPPPPLTMPSTAPTPLVTGPVPPPTSPQFDPFGRAAIEYMGPPGAWPPTPTTNAGQGRGRAVVGGDEEEDDYGELIRLLMTSDAGASGVAADPYPSSSSLTLLHPSDLRMEPLPFSSSTDGTSARYRGRVGCTLPPPLPVVAVASPVPVAVVGGSSAAEAVPTPLPATDSTRDLGTVMMTADDEGNDDATAGDAAAGEGGPGVPVVITVFYTPIPPGAAEAVHAALVRLQGVAAARPGLFLPVLGVCGRGDKRRIALIEGAWPAGRPLPEALSLLVLDGDGPAGSHRRRAAAFLRVGLQLAEALSHLHTAGMGHGAVVPSNVLLDRWTLQAKLTGAWVVELMGSSQQEGEEKGGDDDSALYLAPECWTAPAPGAAADSGSAADVYALAVLLWGVWARQRPYQGLRFSKAELREAVCARGLRPTSAAASVAWDAQQQQQQQQPPPELPLAFEALLAEMWGPDPFARPTAALVAARLRALQAAMD